MSVDIANGEDEALEDAENAVAAAEAHPSTETIQAAETAIAKLPAGPDADALTQRLEAVKAIVRAQDLLEGIASRDLTDPAGIDAAIADLAQARTIIEQLPDDRRGSLQESAAAAQRQIVEAITAVLSAPNQGKPAPVARPWLDLVISETYDRYGKDNLQGQVMRIVADHATGTEVKAAIEEFLAGR
jgi:hypothetical protein